VQYTFYDHTDGYDVAYGDSFSHVSWNDVFKIVERRQYFQIFLSKYDAQLIPKKGFHQAADIDLLKSIFVAKLGSKAKLLSQSGSLV
jgi:hypothetical protein